MAPCREAVPTGYIPSFECDIGENTSEEGLDVQEDVGTP